MTDAASQDPEPATTPADLQPHTSVDWAGAGFTATLAGAGALGWVWFSYTEAYAAVNVRPEEVGVDPLRVLSVTVTVLLSLAAIFGLPILVAWMLWPIGAISAWVGAGAAWLILWRLFVWSPVAMFYVLLLIGLVAIILPVVPRPSWIGPRLGKARRGLTFVVAAGVMIMAGAATANAGDAVRDLNASGRGRSFAGMVLGIRAPTVCLPGNVTLGAPADKPMRLLGTANDVHVLLDGDQVWRVPSGVTALRPVRDGQCVHA